MPPAFSDFNPSAAGQVRSGTGCHARGHQAGAVPCASAGAARGLLPIQPGVHRPAGFTSAEVPPVSPSSMVSACCWYGASPTNLTHLSPSSEPTFRPTVLKYWRTRQALCAPAAFWKKHLCKGWPAFSHLLQVQPGPEASAGAQFSLPRPPHCAALGVVDLCTVTFLSGRA